MVEVGVAWGVAAKVEDGEPGAEIVKVVGFPADDGAGFALLDEGLAERSEA